MVPDVDRSPVDLNCQLRTLSSDSCTTVLEQAERCLYGYSLAPGMPQRVSWLPCMCGPAREAGRQGRGLGPMTVWCGTCSAENHRDATFYEPPHQVGHSRPLSGWVTRPDALVLRRPRPGRWPQPRAGLQLGL
jgi:hypothetical protein